VAPRGITVEALAALTPELANLRAVWSAVLAQSEAETLRRAANLVQNYYFVRGPYREGAELIRAALEYARTLPPTPERIGAQADMLLSLGWFERRSGWLAEARALFLECAACAPDQPRPSGDITEPLTGLGLLALIEGDYREAVHLGLAALERAESEDHRSNQGTALYVLVSAALAQGQYTIATRYTERMTTLIEQIGNTWFLAYCEIDRGHITGGQGDYAAARRLQEALALADAFGATPLQLAVLVTIVEALLHVGRAERGAQLISLVAQCKMQNDDHPVESRCRPKAPYRHPPGTPRRCPSGTPRRCPPGMPRRCPPGTPRRCPPGTPRRCPPGTPRRHP
jgi:tetratricopeptide (TPR) repeat protein